GEWHRAAVEKERPWIDSGQRQAGSRRCRRQVQEASDETREGNSRRLESRGRASARRFENRWGKVVSPVLDGGAGERREADVSREIRQSKAGVDRSSRQRDVVWLDEEGSGESMRSSDLLIWW